MRASFLYFSLLSLSVMPIYTTDGYGEVTHWNPRRGYGAFLEKGEDTDRLIITCDSVATDAPGFSPFTAGAFRSAATGIPSDKFTLSFRAANLNNHPSRLYSYHDSKGRRHNVSSPGWEVEMRGVRGDGVRIWLKSMESNLTPEDGGDGIASRRKLCVVASLSSCPDSVIARSDIAEGLDVNTGMNSFRLVRYNNNWELYGGNRRMNPLLQFEANVSESREIRYSADPGGCLEVAYITFTTPERHPSTISSSYTSLADAKAQAAASPDEMEGEWVVYDRSLEEGRLRMGGDYRLLMLKNDTGYDLVYLAGGITNKGGWEAGMLKARLEATPIPRVWNVTWYDAEQLPISRDVRAQYDSGTSLLTIRFPYSESIIRLYPVR